MNNTRFVLLSLLPLVAGLAGCGPVTLAQAEQSCLRDADLAQRPRGAVTVGVGGGGGLNTGTFGRIEMDVSSDYLRGRDPAAVYDDCVRRRAGQAPSQSYHDRVAG